VLYCAGLPEPSPVDFPGPQSLHRYVREDNGTRGMREPKRPHRTLNACKASRRLCANRLDHAPRSASTPVDCRFATRRPARAREAPPNVGLLSARAADVEPSSPCMSGLRRTWRTAKRSILKSCIHAG
jgi:hypothetical protein